MKLLEESHASTKWGTIKFHFIASLTTFISHNLPFLVAESCEVFLRVPRRPLGSGPAGYSSRATTSLYSPSTPTMMVIFHFRIHDGAY